MKDIVGEHFVANTEHIINHYELSLNFQKDFFEGECKESVENCELNILVYPSHTWPFATFNSIEASLNPALRSLTESFRQYYNKHTQNAHQLDFQLEGSNCDARLTVRAGKYTLEGISILQYLVLALFNREEQVTFKRIKEAFPTLVKYIPSSLIPLCKKSDKQILVKTPAVR